MIRAIFLDRDGVINDNRWHVNQPEDLVLYPGVGKALQKAYEAGYELFIVTNQGGIELGYLTVENLNRIHEKLEKDLEDYCRFTDIVYCPDFKKTSNCRKPKPGMILDLASKYNIDLHRSWMIGDRETDITAGLRAGCQTAKIGIPDSRALLNEQYINNRDKKQKVNLEALIDKIIQRDKEKFGD